MLILGPKTFTVDGVTVFADNADPNQFWYLPGPLQIAQQQGGPAFTFIKYKPSAVAAGAKGGGFVMFDVNLKLRPETQSKIQAKCSEFATGTPVLAVAPFDTGTVRCIALNLQGSGGTSAHPAPAGAFNAVEDILGASIPSMQGDEDAAFSLTLSQEGATILEQAYQQGAAPIGVIYEMKFTALRPALHVKITADFKRIYDYFGASLTGQYYFFKVGIDAGLEKLVQDGVIKMEVIDYVDAADLKSKQQWALDFFKDKLLNDWFEPTLTPGRVSAPSDAGPTPSGGGTTPAHTTTPTRPTTPTTPATSTHPANPTGGGTATATRTTPTTTSTPPTTPATAPARQAATLTIDRRSPDPSPAGYDVTLMPAASGTSETLTIRGASPSVFVDGQPATVNAQGQVALDVAPGSTHEVLVNYAASTAATETFELLFDFEKPLAGGWNPGHPSPPLDRYKNNNPMPRDDAFLASHQPSGGTSSGADALRDWVANRLGTSKNVTVDAHASWESHPSAESLNFDLSRRRLDVALAILGDTAAQVTSANASGCTEAETAQRAGDPHDRVARVVGTTAAARPAVTIHGRVARAGPTPPGPTPPGPTPPGPTPPGPTPPGPTPPGPTPPGPTPSQPIAGSPEIALKLRYIHQEEQKTLTFIYDEQDATQQTYAPQGFFDAMLGDLADDDKHFIEVDLDDPFFRTFTVTIDAPIAFDSIGLVSSHVAIDYGDPSSAATDKHGDFIFDRTNHAQQKFQVYVDKGYDTTYRHTLEYHFDPNAGWDSNAYSYAFPAKVSEDRTLSLNPYEQLGFLTVNIFPGRLDPVLITSTDVNLQIADGTAGTLTRTINVAPGQALQTWKVRLGDPSRREYTYQFVHHLKDGSTRTSDPVTTQATAIPVDDPFTHAIDVDFVPLFDPTKTRMVFVDVQYHDVTNSYDREDRLQLTGASRSPVHLRIALLDPAQTTYSYRLTFVGNDDSMNQRPFVSTTETLIPVK